MITSADGPDGRERRVYDAFARPVRLITAEGTIDRVYDGAQVAQELGDCMTRSKEA